MYQVSFLNFYLKCIDLIMFYLHILCTPAEPLVANKMVLFCILLCPIEFSPDCDLNGSNSKLFFLYFSWMPN